MKLDLENVRDELDTICVRCVTTVQRVRHCEIGALVNRRFRGDRDNGFLAAVALMCLLLLSWVFGTLSAPGWAYTGLLLLSGLVAAWAVWTFVRDREDKRGYLVAALALFILLNSIAGQLDASEWVHVVLILLFAPVAVWKIRNVVMTLR